MKKSYPEWFHVRNIPEMKNYKTREQTCGFEGSETVEEEECVSI